MDTLFQLKKHNSLYYNTVINYDMLKNMPNKFIFKEILSRVVIINQDSEKCKKYKANPNINNNKNNL